MCSRRVAVRFEQQRARAEQRLADAEAKLKRLGWRGRRGHGAELRAEIAFQQTSLRLADDKLAELPSLVRVARVAASREPSEFARKRLYQLGQRREAVEGIRKRPLQRDLGLER